MNKDLRMGNIRPDFERSAEEGVLKTTGRDHLQKNKNAPKLAVQGIAVCKGPRKNKKLRNLTFQS